MVKDGVLIILIIGGIIATQFMYGFLTRSFNIVDKNNVVSTMIAVLLTFLIYRTYEKKIVSILNKTFFRKHHSRRIQLANLNEDIVCELDMERLSRIVVDRMVAIFDIPYAALFVKKNNENHFTLLEQRGLDIQEEQQCVADEESIVCSLVRRRRHIFYKRSYHFLSWNEAVHVDTFFERYSAKVIFPFFHEGRLLAFLTLGYLNRSRWLNSEIGDSYYSLAKHAGQAFWNALRIDEAETHADVPAEQSVFLQQLKLEAIDKLATGVAHEIRNPLTIISLRAQRLLQKNARGTVAKEEVDKALQTIEQQISRAKSITSRLIRFAKNEEHIQPVSINPFVEELLEIISYQVSLSHINMMKFIDPVLPPVMAKTSDLRELFMNLIINAVEALGGGGGSICLYVRYNREQHAVEAHCMDNAKVTLTDEQLACLGDPFYTHKETGNPGLGLFTCKKIVSAYGGTIIFKRNKPHGLDVAVTLPCGENTDHKPYEQRPCGELLAPQGGDTERIGDQNTEDVILPLDIVRELVFEKEEVIYGTDAHS